MSEGPEVRRTADRLADALLGRRVEAFESRRVRALPPCAARIVGSRVMSIRAHGKQLVFRFSRRVYLRNHMLMWGKWRTYTRDAYESGCARPPPRVSWRRNRPGARPPPAAVMPAVRLVLLTGETAAVQFNWVFRRGGQPCYRCGERILTDRRSSRRVTFWCPGCQPV